MIDWGKARKKDHALVAKIIKKFWTETQEATSPFSSMGLTMSLIACHTHGCPLDLDKMLKADTFTLNHDIYGIHNHINMETGGLENCFVPRCALRGE